jgi:hypothetical protein
VFWCCCLLRIIDFLLISGLTCDSVGSMQNNDPATSPLCDGSSDTKSLAGYKYIAEQEIMNQASLIDVDM